MTNPLVEQLISHDIDDTRALLALAAGLTDAQVWEVRVPGVIVLEWDGPEETIGAVLTNLVWTKETWLAAIEGRDSPARPVLPDIPTLIARHDAAAVRWLTVVSGVDARGAWGDRFIDALCDPPESFVLSGVVAHVLTFSAHRRQLVRQMLRTAGHRVGSGDPNNWLRRRRNEATGDELE